MANTVYMMIGAPYSGKTYYISHNEVLNKLPRTSSDDIVHKMCRDNNVSYDDGFTRYIKPASKLLKQQVLDLLSSQQDFIFDRTNTTIEGRKKWIGLFKSYGYQVVAVFIKPPEDSEELDRRIAMRTDQVIPRNVVYSMINQLQKPSLDEGFSKIITS